MLSKVDPVEVYCRVRPLKSDESSCVQILDDSTLMLQIPEVSFLVFNGYLCGGVGV